MSVMTLNDSEVAAIRTLITSSDGWDQMSRDELIRYGGQQMATASRRDLEKWADNCIDLGIGVADE